MEMIISTWNIERFKHKDKEQQMYQLCHEQKADILVLTESDRQFKQDYSYEFHTPLITQAPEDYFLPARYEDTENRVSIYSNYPLVKMHETHDKYTAICAELATDCGNLLVYGTIVGILGNRTATFKDEVRHHIEDIQRLSKLGNICICGDFNCSFSDNYYFTNFARKSFLNIFEQENIKLLTKVQPECIDHIAVFGDFEGDMKCKVSEWNLEKKLSDHKGITVELY